MIELYKHNLEAYLKVKKMFQEERKACIIHATGTGKSFVALKLIEDQILENPDSKIVYFTPLNGIASQIEEHLVSMGLEDKYLKNIEFINYQTANNKLKDDSINDVEADLFITDEFHHIGAPEWTRALETIFNNNMDAKIFGMTATAVRRMGTNDEENVSETFFEGNVASEFDLADAIAQGVLPEPEYHTAPIYLLEEAKELEEFINSNELDDADASKYIEVLQDIKKQISKMETETDIFKNNIDVSGKYIYFCPKGSDIKELQEAFMEKLSVEQRNNVEFYQVHSATYNSKTNENAAYNFYHNMSSDNSMQDVGNKLRVMFAIDMYNEGIHVPDINGIIMGRETRSDILYYQQLGRSLAVKKKSDNERENNAIKSPVVIDLMGNINNMYTLSQKVVVKRNEKLENSKDEESIGSKDNFFLTNEDKFNQNSGIKFGLSDEIINILDAINEIKSYRNSVDTFDINLSKLIKELRETGEIIKYINSDGTRRETQSYNFMRYHKEKILKAAADGNELALELVTNDRYFWTDEQKLQNGLQIAIDELRETGEIIRFIKIDGKQRPTQSYRFMVEHKEKILKAAEDGNELAIELVTKDRYFWTDEQKAQTDAEEFKTNLQIAIKELRETGGVIKSIKIDGKQRPTQSYNFMKNHKEEILKAAENGNELAIELVTKDRLFWTDEQKLQVDLQSAVDEFRETGEIIKSIQIDGKQRPTQSYIFMRDHKEEILKAAEDGNELAIELVTKDSYFWTDEQKAQADAEKFKTNLQIATDELRETGEIVRIIEGTNKYTQSYRFMTRDKEKILKAAENGNKLAIELVTKDSYFWTEEQKLQNGLQIATDELRETGEIIKTIKIDGKQRQTQSYRFMQDHKEEILKAAENGNEIAIELVTKDSYFWTDEQKLQNGLQIATDELRETGEIIKTIKIDGKQKRTQSYRFMQDHKEEILKAAEEGNEDAIELVTKDEYFWTDEQKLQNGLQIVTDELRETGEIIRYIKIDGPKKSTQSYNFMQNYKEEILKAAEDGNELAIELVTNDNYFWTDEQKAQADAEVFKANLQNGVDELRKTGKISPYIETEGENKPNPIYTFISNKKKREQVFSTAFGAADKDFEEMSEVEKLSIQLVSQSKLLQKHLALKVAKEEHNASCDFTKLAEMISNKEKGNGNESKL